MSLDFEALAVQPIPQEMLAALSCSQKKQLKLARERVLFPNICVSEGHALVSTGRFEAEAARIAAKSSEQQVPAQTTKRIRRKKGAAIVPGKGQREVCELAVNFATVVNAGPQ